ncbi:MAG: hypothetical protein H6662_02840 [Ardenticatenaceae bacterium]|nr:hypothetical protein [Ardenticatenaceae bacterium]
MKTAVNGRYNIWVSGADTNTLRQGCRPGAWRRWVCLTCHLKRRFLKQPHLLRGMARAARLAAPNGADLRNGRWHSLPSTQPCGP